VIVYPNSQPPIDGRFSHQRNERACFTISSFLIEELFMDLPDELEDAAAFHKGAGQLQQKILGWIATGFGDNRNALFGDKPTAIYWFEYEGSEGVHALDLG